MILVCITFGCMLSVLLFRWYACFFIFVVASLLCLIGFAIWVLTSDVPLSHFQKLRVIERGSNYLYKANRIDNFNHMDLSVGVLKLDLSIFKFKIRGSQLKSDQITESDQHGTIVF